MTEQKRAEQLEHVGAVNLHIEVTIGHIEVRAANTDVAEVTLTPVMPGDEVALDLIKRAVVDRQGSRFRVVVPPPPATVSGGGVQTVVGSHNVVVGNVFGAVISAGNIYVGDGGVHIGGRSVVGGVSVGGAGQVRVEATVPSDSHVSGKTLSGSMNVYVDSGAEIAETVFTSTNGDLTVVGSRRVNAHTINGDITADGAEWMHANSTSGDIRAESLAGTLNARSVSGDVRAHAVGDGSVRASSVSGDITVTRASGVTVSVDAGSVSGRVRT